MKPWAEDNYLERLMPQLRQANQVHKESCPDSELLTAFVEDQVNPFVRNAITAHLKQCPECTEICARLVSFAREAAPVPEAEWVNAGKRLDNWMDGLLRSKAAASGFKLEAVPSRVPRWKDTSKGIFSWRLPWAVGAMAALALVVGTVLVTRRSSVQPVAVQPVTPRVTNIKPEQPTVEKAAGQTPTQPLEASQKPAPEIKRDSTTAPKDLPETSVAATSASQPKASLPSSAPEQKDEGTSQAAETYSPPDLSPNDRILAGSNSSAPSKPASIARAATSSRPAAPASSATKGSNLAAAPAATTASHPAVLRLEAGTRLWIQVNSISRQTDGSFTFKGNLLQPVVRTGAVPMDPGTELAGAGTVKNGKVTAFVNGFVLQGVPYTLSGATGALSEQMPGAGKAVQFQNGQVLEMWLSSASIYEKRAEGSSIEQSKH